MESLVSATDLYDELSDLPFPLSPQQLAPDRRLLDLLSASLYPSFTQDHAADSNGTRSLGQGLRIDNTPPIAHSKGARVPPRKARFSKDTRFVDDQGRNHRGRPQKSNGKDSSTDKRRVQIRMAQRAYRSRQESEVSTLKERVMKLEGLVKNMGQMYLDLKHDAIVSRVFNDHSEMAARLDEIVENYLSLAGHGDNNENELRIIAENPAPSAPSSRSRISAANQRGQKDALRKEIKLADNTACKHSAAIPSRQFGSESSTSEPTGIPENEERNEHMMSPFSDATLFSSFLTPNSGLEPMLSAGNRVNKKALADRLDLVCASRAYSRLRDPSVTTTQLSRGFGFLLAAMSRDQITAYFKDYLDSLGASEVLDSWKAPKIILGGAGTHFPRGMPATNYETNARVQEPPAKGGKMGTISPKASMESKFQGEWYDSGDVEGFLETYGIKTECQSTAPGASSNLTNDGTQSETLWPSLPPGTVLVINESKLMKYLSTVCICLGRSAAFRRKDVENYVSGLVRLHWA